MNNNDVEKRAKFLPRKYDICRSTAVISGYLMRFFREVPARKPFAKVGGDYCK